MPSRIRTSRDFSAVFTASIMFKSPLFFARTRSLIISAGRVNGNGFPRIVGHSFSIKLRAYTATVSRTSLACAGSFRFSLSSSTVVSALASAITAACTRSLRSQIQTALKEINKPKASAICDVTSASNLPNFFPSRPHKIGTITMLTNTAMHDQSATAIMTIRPVGNDRNVSTTGYICQE